MKKYLNLLFILLLFSCGNEEGDPNLLSTQLEKTVWVGDENYRNGDYGFSGIVGFKGGRIYELNDWGKDPIGCFPYNRFFRDWNGEIQNLKDEGSKITFDIVYNVWIDFTEIEIINGKLRITTTSECGSVPISV